MDEESCCVPPGFRFHPTDEELVGYYLKKKVASQRIDLDVIREIDLYKIEPWDLQERCRIGYEEQKEWYFFSHKDKKYPTGRRSNRATVSGFWKATGRDKAVYQNSKLIGMRKTLVYYRGRAPNGQKSDWIIHEYYMLDSHHTSPPLQEEGWVVCRAFKKRSNVGSKRRQVWDTNCFFYDANLLDPLPLPLPLQHIANKRARHNSQYCKQELLAEVNNSLMCRLPQLETPSEITPLQSCNNKSSLEDEVSAEKMITDWRSLDKFVASQFLMTPQD